MTPDMELLTLAKRIQALSENGQHFSESEYDLDRYRELEAISLEMMEILSGHDLQKLQLLTSEKNGYRTAKVDVRAVAFNDRDELLLVHENIDGKWSLPGGWADVGYTPAEVAEKETMEEAGVKVAANRLLAVFDKRCHDHPPDLYYAYKLFIECDILDPTIDPGFEACEARFFSLQNLPELSKPRNTYNQVKMMFDHRRKPMNWPYLDKTEQ